jgi:hypothetical protein
VKTSEEPHRREQRLNLRRLSTEVFGAGCAPVATLQDSATMKRLLMLLGVAVMSTVAAPAYADPPSDNDAKFLKELTAAGLTYQDPDAAIAVAKNVCDLVDKGTPDTDIVKNLQLHNPQFTGAGAARFTTLAAASYCPKYLTGDGRPPKPSGAGGN